MQHPTFGFFGTKKEVSLVDVAALFNDLKDFFTD